MCHKKIIEKNPHAEDWVISSLISSYLQAKEKNPQLLFFQFIDAHKFTNPNKNRPEIDYVFSLKVNYAPCDGCVETLINFKHFLDKNLTAFGKQFILRVKFFHIYPRYASIAELMEKTQHLSTHNIKVKMQSHASLSRMINKPYPMTSGYTIEDESLQPLLQTWRDLDAHRKI